MRLPEYTADAIADAVTVPGAVVELPAGELDMPALPLRNVAPGVRLVAHEAGTTLRGVLDVQPPGLGWRTPLTPTGGPTATTTANLRPGDWCFVWRQAEQNPPLPTLCQRLRVEQVTSRHVRFNANVFTTADKVKTFERAWCVQDGAERRSIELFLDGPSAPNAGEVLLLTDGPRYANECAPAEFVEVVDAAHGWVELDRPLQNDYASPLLCRVRPPVNLSVEGLSVQPAGGYAGHVKGCPGLKLVDCASTQTLYLTTCSDVTVTNYRGPLLLNGVTGITVMGGRLTTFGGEEGCSLATVVDAEYGPSPQNAINWHTHSDRLTVRGGRVVGAALHPLAIDGADCRVEGLTVDAGPGRESYLGGDRLVVRDLIHPERRLYFLGGHYQSVSGGWIHYANYGGDPDGEGNPPAPSGGVSVGVQGAVGGNGLNYVIGPGARWRVL